MPFPARFRGEHPTLESGTPTPLRRKTTTMESSSPSPAPPPTAAVAVTGRGRTLSRENSAKSMVTDQISQAVLSTSNLLHIMLQSSSSQENLVKLPKNLLAKASTIKNTQQVLEQMPSVISSLDAHMDNGLESVSHLETVTRLLRNIGNNQLKPLTDDQVLIEEPEPDTSRPPVATQPEAHIV